MNWLETTYDLLSKGGIVMIPLVAFSVVALWFTIERALYLRPRKVLPPGLFSAVLDRLKEGKIGDGLNLCQMNESSLARVLEAGLKKSHAPIVEIEKGLEAVGKAEHAKLSAFLPFLNIVAGVSPLLGLLGTVIGMIKTFTVIELQGLSNTESLAGGISEALISTAAGLTVAIPYFIAARYFAAKVERLTLRLEENAEGLLETINHSREQKESA